MLQIISAVKLDPPALISSWRMLPFSVRPTQNAVT